MYLYITLSITIQFHVVAIYVIVSIFAYCKCISHTSYRQQKAINTADVLHFTNKEAVIYDDIDVCMTTKGKAFYVTVSTADLNDYSTVSEVSVNDSIALDSYTYAIGNE